MTNKYPRLTVENVQYWYWKNDPPLSQRDIAEKIHCSCGYICQFMKRNNIPARDHSEAGKNIYLCFNKKERHLRKVSSKEFRKSLSEVMTDVWSDPKSRSLRMKKLQKFNRIQLGQYQELILEVLNSSDGMFVPEFRAHSKFKQIPRHSIMSSLKKLYNRRIVGRKKILNSNYKLKINKFQFQYFITKFGENIFKTFRDCNYKVRNINSTKTGEKFKDRLGKNQKEILILLEESGSLFMTEIYSKLNYLSKNIDTLRDSLLRLYRRGIIFRIKKININSKSKNRLHYKFSITEKGIKLFKSAS